MFLKRLNCCQALSFLFFANLLFVNAGRLVFCVTEFFSLDISFRSSICKKFVIIVLAAVVAMCCFVNFLHPFVLHKKQVQIKEKN